jgi:hypothetical protein
MLDPNVNYELLPTHPQDETEVNLRSYFSRLSDERLMEYDPSWSDEQVMAWDDNFTSEGELFLICCEREVDVDEYRRVLVEHMALRQLTPKAKA